MKKNYFVLIFALCFAFISKAQWNLEYGGSAGTVNYIGDIGGTNAKRFSDLQLQKTRWNLGGYVRYKVHPRFSLRASLENIRLEGDDKYASDNSRIYRNLSFRNNVWDLGITAQAVLYENLDLSGRYNYRQAFRIYIFAGGGIMYTNPKTLYMGQWVPLRPLQTEGVKYSRIAFNVPMGIGFNLTVQKKHRIGLEINFRKTNTDYLDDVSGKWANPENMSAKGQALYNRNPEVESQPEGMSGNYGWIDDGKGNNMNKAVRGNPNNKDNYVMLTVSYGRVIKGQSKFHKAAKKARRQYKIRSKF